MNNEGKFKKSLSDLVNSKEFEFDEANWEKASEMIEASRGARGWKGTSIVLSSLLLFIAGIAGAYLLYPSDSPKITAAKPKVERVISGSSQDVVKNENLQKTGISAGEKTNVRPKTKPILKSSEKEAAPIIETTTAAHITNNTPPAKTVADPIVEKLIPENTTPVRESKPKQEVALTSFPEKTTEAQTQTTASVSIQSGESKSEIRPATSVTDNNSDVTPDIKMLAQVKPEIKSEPETVSASEKEEINTSTKLLGLTDNDSSQQSESKELKEEQNPRSTLIQPAQINPELANEVKNPELSSKSSSEPPKGVGIYPLLPAPDSAMLENDHATKLTYDIKEKPVFLSIEAGVSYFYGWKNPGNTDAAGYNPFVGINYFQAVHNKLTISLGLQYTTVSNLNYSNHVTKVSQLGLGEESTVTVFTPTKIHYLLAPLRVHYRLNQKNIVGLGCNFAYLLTVESDVETYHQTINSTDGHTIYKDKGYTQGFSPLDVQTSVFYRRRLLSNLSFNAELFYGLVDTKDNTFFHSNVFERNTGLKISLVYNILKK